MLKTRVLTALVLAPLVILAIFSTSEWIFSGLIITLVIFMAWEWAKLIKLDKLWQQLAFVGFVCLAGFFAKFIAVNLLFGCSFVVWFFALWQILKYKGAAPYWSSSLVIKCILGTVILVSFGVALITLRGEIGGQLLILMLLLIIWSADTGAYFAGRKWGKHPLAKFVSPNKTIEGGIGGAVLSLIIASSVAFTIFKTSPENSTIMFNNQITFVLVVLMTMMFSIVGDLFESLIKRIHGVKDSGKCLPGHGGLLDRFDSLLAAAPVFTLSSILING